MDIHLLRKAQVPFDMPLPGMEGTQRFVQHLIPKVDLEVLEAERQHLLCQMQEALAAGDLDPDRLKEIKGRLRALVVEAFCARIAEWPFVDAGRPVPVTPEAVERYELPPDLLDSILAWASESRYPKPGTGSS